MQVNFDFKDSRGEHTYIYEWEAMPRVGDYVELLGDEYKITKVTWSEGGLPTYKCKPTR
jgi:hypothetical protein